MITSEIYGEDQNKLWEILPEMVTQDPLDCLLRNLYADQKVNLRTRHETIDCERENVKFQNCEREM